MILDVLLDENKEYVIFIFIGDENFNFVRMVLMLGVELEDEKDIKFKK